MLKKIILFLLVFSFQISAWELSKTQDGIKVYTRVIEGSNLKEFKAITKMKTSLSGLVALIKDESAFPLWYPDTKTAKILKEFSPTDWIIYFHIAAPFPVSDRDMNNRFTITQNSSTKTVLINISTDPKYSPEKSGNIRINKLKGSWTFAPQDDGESVEVTYQMHSEPGGSIPDFLANSAVTDTPVKVLTNMKKIIAKEKYQNSKFDFIK